MRCKEKVSVQESFLLDEVRCGFFVPAAIKQAWAAQLEVLMEIDRVCELHNIEYFADWGTLLGAVRHGGFIPWDDDLDIVMKREDYQKFMEVARFDMEEGFDVQTFRNQKDFWLFMGKVVGKNRFCFEKEHLRRFHNFPYIACVDIFVLDYAYRDPEKEENRKTICKYLLGIADGIVEGRIDDEEAKDHLKRLEEMTGQKFDKIADSVEMGRYLYGEVEKRFAEVSEEDADNLVQMFPWGLKQNVNYYTKEYYERPVYVPFECVEMPVSPLYDKMLRMRYGEYWRPVKDAGAHNYPFFEGQKVNLQKVLDFDLPAFRFSSDMLKRTEEEKACAQLSYKAMAKECIAELQKMQEELSDMLTDIFKGAVQYKVEEQQHLLDLLGGSQQLAVDLGTLLEQMHGENCGIVSMLEQYCEVLYQIYEQLHLETDLNDNRLPEVLYQALRRIVKELEGTILAKKRVLFLPVMAKDWKGLHSLWQAARADENCEVSVVPLPYYYKDYDGSAKTVCYEGEKFPEKIAVSDYKLLTPEYLELLRPEVIVIQNPYDAWHPAICLPEQFYAENLRRYTDKLVYVPPFMVDEFTKANAREYANLQYYATIPGVIYADRVITQSENMKCMYVEKLTEFAGEDTRECWQEKIKPYGLPVMDNSDGNVSAVKCRQSNDRKRILYGISSSVMQEKPEEAKRKLESNLKLFETYQDEIEVVITRFPEENLKSAGDFDAYYGDPMPIMMKFIEDKKPVMIQNVELL